LLDGYQITCATPREYLGKIVYGTSFDSSNRNFGNSIVSLVGHARQPTHLLLFEGLCWIAKEASAT